MYGSLLSPSVVFSKDGKRILPVEIKEPMTEMVYSSSLGGHSVRFYKDGIVIIDSLTTEEALDRLNCFVLCFRLLRLPGHSVPVFNPDELFTIRKDVPLANVPRSREPNEKNLNGEEDLPLDAGTEFRIDSGTL